jgi:hypothetical protein
MAVPGIVHSVMHKPSAISRPDAPCAASIIGWDAARPAGVSWLEDERDPAGGPGGQYLDAAAWP